MLQVANPDGGPGDPDDTNKAGKNADGAGSGLDSDAGGGSKAKNPLQPPDGAGPRSIPGAVLAAQRQVEMLKRRSW